MVDDDGSFLSRRLHWGPEGEADPESGAGTSQAPGYDAEAWDDEVGAGGGGRTEVVAAGGGVSAGRSFERRELDRMDEEALDRRRQLWRDTALLLSLLLVVLIGANLVIPELTGAPGASPTPVPTSVVAGGKSAAPSAGSSEAAASPSATPTGTPHSGPSITQPPTGTAAPTHPGATPRPTARPSPTPAPPTPRPTPRPTPGPTPTPTPEITPEPTPAPPVAAFTWSQAVPLTISFTNTSSGETDWLWDFGDGSTSSQQNPDHPYLDPGDYVVRLTVTGPGGTDFVEHTVTVSAT
jgi:hypothetical protein